MTRTNHKNLESEISVSKTRWMNNERNTILLTIPHQYRKKYDLGEPTNVLIIPTDQGILIRKIDMERIK